MCTGQTGFHSQRPRHSMFRKNNRHTREHPRAKRPDPRTLRASGTRCLTLLRALLGLEEGLNLSEAATGPRGSGASV